MNTINWIVLNRNMDEKMREELGLVIDDDGEFWYPIFFCNSF